MKLQLRRFKNSPLDRFIGRFVVAIIFGAAVVSVIVIPYGVILAVITGKG